MRAQYCNYSVRRHGRATTVSEARRWCGVNNGCRSQVGGDAPSHDHGGELCGHGGCVEEGVTGGLGHWASASARGTRHSQLRERGGELTGGAESQ